MAAISKGTTFATGDQVTALSLNNLVDNSTFASGAVDNTSTQLSSGAIIVKDGGVTTAKLNDGAVTTAKIAGANVTTAKIADANVTFAKLTDVIDDDTMATATNTTLATSESIKAYVDATAGGFTPSAYTGEESVTLPNSLIMKFGTVTAGISGTPVSFASAFPTAAIWASACPNSSDNLTQATGYSGKASVDSLSTSGVNVSCNGSAYWQAIGY